MEDINGAKSLFFFGRGFFDPNREVKEAALEALAEKRGVDVTQIVPQVKRRQPSLASTCHCFWEGWANGSSW